MKEAFLSYEAARKSGNFNMIMDAQSVMRMYNISSNVYWYIIEHYSELAKKYL